MGNPTMLGLDNPIHLAFILMLLLLVFGAKRLPEIGRSLGSGMREFKHSVTGESHPQQPALNAGQPQQAPAPAPVAEPAPVAAPAQAPVAAPAQAPVAQPTPSQAAAPEPEQHV